MVLENCLVAQIIWLIFSYKIKSTESICWGKKISHHVHQVNDKHSNNMYSLITLPV